MGKRKFSRTSLVHRAMAWNGQLCGSRGQRSRSQDAEIGYENHFTVRSQKLSD